MSKDILQLYHQRNIDELCKSNLKTKLDTDGNTVFHIIAMNLDQETLGKIHQQNPSQTQSCINIANNLGELPLHKALDSVNKTAKQDDQIITYMIKVLGADPNIPDHQNRIVVPMSETASPTSSLHNRIMKLNNDVIQNIVELSKLNGSDLKALHQHSMSESSSELSDQLRNIFGKQKGQRSDSQIQLPNKKSSISTYMGKESSDKLEFIKSLIKLYRSNDLDEENKNKEMWGGLGNSGDLDDLDDLGDFSMHGGYKGSRKINAYVSDSNDFRIDNPNEMLGMLAMQDRPKMDPQVFAENNEIYKEIIQKIKSHLDVSDEIAKTIAAYLKIQVRKEISESDPSKIDRAKLDMVKEIVNDKDTLDRQYGEMKTNKLFEEIQKNREERQKRRAEHKTKGTVPTDSSDDKSNTSDKEVAEEKPKKKRTTKKTDKVEKAEQSRISNAKKKIASNGYLNSDEIVFSPDY